jgi:hypothetical protein
MQTHNTLQGAGLDVGYRAETAKATGNCCASW